MNEGPPIDAELLPPESSTVVKRDPNTPAQPQQITAAQARIEAVADLTKTALALAGTLKLSQEETNALIADFPDDAFKPGAAGKETLLYIEHAALRDRLNTTLGLGQWAVIVRETWNEPFKTQAGKDAVRVYARGMLLVRGVYVGEAVGEMEYFPHNAGQNYGDAFEGAKTAAFRRCAKEFGIGLQAWRKDWGDGWWARKRGQTPSPTSKPVQTPSTTQKPPESKPAPAKATPAKPVASKADVLPKKATIQTRNWMIEQLLVVRDEAMAFAIDKAIIMPNETLEDWPLDQVPTSKQAMSLLLDDIAKASGKKLGDDPNDPDSRNAPWRTYPMPWGKQAGALLGDLPKNYLFGLFANFQVEPEYNGKPKKPETVEKERTLRKHLDAAGAHYGFQKPEDAPPVEQPTGEPDSDLPF